ncbi:hypothetical protein VN97_g5310 [Penicillium thymicola]|uniref:Uncharacterized protein n=1 Tax=Penicillium thymicola TaxID=293382 RepID=A0AAI9TJ02_PENTH|nr:hypothetical protein VN97_g5310 [Penicillium thymicola]
MLIRSYLVNCDALDDDPVEPLPSWQGFYRDVLAFHCGLGQEVDVVRLKCRADDDRCLIDKLGSNWLLPFADKIPLQHGDVIALSRYNHEGQHSSYSSILQLFANRYAQSLYLFCYTNAAQHVYFTTTLAGRPTGTVRYTPAISPCTTCPRLFHFRGLEGEFDGGPHTQAV